MATLTADVEKASAECASVRAELTRMQQMHFGDVEQIASLRTQQQERQQEVEAQRGISAEAVRRAEEARADQEQLQARVADAEAAAATAATALKKAAAARAHHGGNTARVAAALDEVRRERRRAADAEEGRRAAAAEAVALQEAVAVAGAALVQMKGEVEELRLRWREQRASERSWRQDVLAASGAAESNRDGPAGAIAVGGDGTVDRDAAVEGPYMHAGAARDGAGEADSGAGSGPAAMASIAGGLVSEAGASGTPVVQDGGNAPFPVSGFAQGLPADAGQRHVDHIAHGRGRAAISSHAMVCAGSDSPQFSDPETEAWDASTGDMSSASEEAGPLVPPAEAGWTVRERTVRGLEWAAGGHRDGGMPPPVMSVHVRTLPPTCIGRTM